MVRTVLLWLGVAAFVVTATWALVVEGQPTALVGFVAFPAVGAIILASQPRNGVGWYLYGVGLVWTISTLDSLVGAPAWVEALGTSIGWLVWIPLPLIGLLFPTGIIETRFGRILAWQLLVITVVTTLAGLATTPVLLDSGRPNPLAVPALEPIATAVLQGPIIAYFGLLVVGIVVDLSLRWRRSRGARRLQYRWLVFGLTVTVVLVALSGTWNVLFPGQVWVEIWSAVATFSTNLIPVTIGIAVTRHGLYEIGRVISRTVSYAVVALLIVGTYALVVTSVAWILPDLPAIGVALATLAAATALLPALRGVQRILDRRFDRERYDSAHVVDAFGEYLRTDIDPAATGPELITAIDRALAPASVGLWTNGGSR